MLDTTTLALVSPEKLRAAMTKAEKSTRTLAADVGCSRARVQQLAAGQFPQTSAAIAVALCAALDVDVKDLFYFPDGEALVRLGLIRAA